MQLSIVRLVLGAVYLSCFVTADPTRFLVPSIRFAELSRFNYSVEEVRNYASLLTFAALYDFSDVSSDCIDDLQILTNGNLYNLTFTTIEDVIAFYNSLPDAQKELLLDFVDSSGKIGAGIKRGHRNFNGLYSECISIQYDVEGRSRKLEGGYARVFIDLNFANYTSPAACQATTFGVLAFGLDVCVPMSCSNSRDLTIIARSLGAGPEGGSPVCGVSSIIEQGRKKDYRTWIVVAVIVLTGVLALIGTICDYYFREQIKERLGGEPKALLCLYAFSWYSNIGAIFDTSNVNKPGQIGSIHFMRFMSMMWVVLGHVAMMTAVVSSNPLDVAEDVKDVSTQILTNAYFAVDTFFFMSGLLLGFIWFKDFYRNKRRQMSPLAWIMFYVHRILRIIPPYYMVIAYYAFVQRTYLINMPNYLNGWPDTCERYWWINYLFLNNYIHYGQQCYLISWYLATDIQMYIFAPLILIPLALYPIVGLAVAVLIFLVSTGANIGTVFKYYFPPSDYSFGAFDPRMGNFDHYIIVIYDAPWIRCQVYIIGLLTGYLLQTKKKLHIPWWLNLPLWVLSMGMGAMVVLVITDWSNGRVYPLIESAMYSALSKPAWAFALSFMVISCYYGYGGALNHFMSWSVWVPLGRLTYCGYLVHFCVISYLMGMSNIQITYTNFSESFVTFTMPAIVLTFFFAIFWSALFEISTGKIEMLFLGGARGRSPKSAVQPLSPPEDGLPVKVVHKTSITPEEDKREPPMVTAVYDPNINGGSQPEGVKHDEVWDFQKPQQAGDAKKRAESNAYKDYKSAEERSPPASAFGMYSDLKDRERILDAAWAPKDNSSGVIKRPNKKGDTAISNVWS